MTTTDTPRIYVASLSDYNAGRLHGRWIDAAQDVDVIEAEVLEMLAESSEPGAEEWAIHDYDNFGGLRLGEWESFERVAEIAKAIEEHGAGPVGAYLSNDSSADLADFEECYRGEWPSVEDYAQELAEDCAPFSPGSETARVLESWPYSYIDWERAARDLELGGDIWTADAPDGGVYVFDGTV
jgi:antirestriction protein